MPDGSDEKKGGRTFEAERMNLFDEWEILENIFV